MKYSTLGLDLDGTTYDLFTVFRNHWANLKDIDPETLGTEPLRWGFFEEWGCSVGQFFSILRQGVKKGTFFWEGEPYPDAVEVIQRLSGDHKIVFVSHRNYEGLERTCAEATISWLNKYEIPYDDVLLTEKKTGLGLDLILDDAPHIIQEAKDAGEKAVFFDAPPNRHIHHARVHGWKDFERFVA